VTEFPKTLERTVRPKRVWMQSSRKNALIAMGYTGIIDATHL
jgi:hypothetical protein